MAGEAGWALSLLLAALEASYLLRTLFARLDAERAGRAGGSAHVGFAAAAPAADEAASLRARVEQLACGGCRHSKSTLGRGPAIR